MITFPKTDQICLHFDHFLPFKKRQSMKRSKDPSFKILKLYIVILIANRRQCQLQRGTER